MRGALWPCTPAQAIVSGRASWPSGAATAQAVTSGSLVPKPSGSWVYRVGDGSCHHGRHDVDDHPHLGLHDGHVPHLPTHEHHGVDVDEQRSRGRVVRSTDQAMVVATVARGIMWVGTTRRGWCRGRPQCDRQGVTGKVTVKVTLGATTRQTPARPPPAADGPHPRPRDGVVARWALHTRLRAPPGRRRRGGGDGGGGGDVGQRVRTSRGGCW